LTHGNCWPCHSRNAVDQNVAFDDLFALGRCGSVAELGDYDLHGCGFAVVSRRCGVESVSSLAILHAQQPPQTVSAYQRAASNPQQMQLALLGEPTKRRDAQP
jgi:hypothetical protein